MLPIIHIDFSRWSIYLCFPYTTVKIFICHILKKKNRTAYAHILVIINFFTYSGTTQWNLSASNESQIDLWYQISCCFSNFYSGFLHRTMKNSLETSTCTLASFSLDFPRALPMLLIHLVIKSSVFLSPCSDL